MGYKAELCEGKSVMVGKSGVKLGMKPREERVQVVRGGGTREKIASFLGVIPFMYTMRGYGMEEVWCIREKWCKEGYDYGYYRGIKSDQNPA